MAAAKGQATVKNTSFTRFGKRKAYEEKVQRVIPCSPDCAYSRSAIRGMDFHFQKAGRDKNAELGFLWKAVRKYAKLSQFVIDRNPLRSTSLKVSAVSFVAASEIFCLGFSSNAFTTEKIFQCLDVGRRRIQDREDALAPHLSTLPWTIKSSRTTFTAQSSEASGIVCSYCQDSRDGSPTCPENEHRNTRCAFSTKLGHTEPRCLKKPEKNALSAHVVTEIDNSFFLDALSTARVTLLEYDHYAASRKYLVASIKRTGLAEGIAQQVRHNTYNSFQASRPLQVRIEDFIQRMEKKCLDEKSPSEASSYSLRSVLS